MGLSGPADEMNSFGSRTYGMAGEGYKGNAEECWKSSYPLYHSLLLLSLLLYSKSENPLSTLFGKIRTSYISRL